MRQVTERFIADPEVRQLKYLPDLEFLVAAWTNGCGDLPASNFSRIQVVSFRDKLLAGDEGGNIPAIRAAIPGGHCERVLLLNG